MDSTQPKHKEAVEEGLTPIHPRIHCVATQDGPEEQTETDKIMGDLERLVEMARGLGLEGVLGGGLTDVKVKD